MKKYMPLEGLRWSRDSGSTLCDTPQNGRSRTGWGGGRTEVFSWLLCINQLEDLNAAATVSFTDIILVKGYIVS